MFDLSDFDSWGGYEEEAYNYPPVSRLSIEEVENTKMCLCDDGVNLYLYIIDYDWVVSQDIFEGEEFNEEGLKEDGKGGKIREFVEELRSYGTRFL